MGLRLITAPSEDPVTLAEVRLQCRITGTDEDSLLTAYIKAATKLCESKTRRKIITQTWEQSFDLFPESEIRLDCSPVQSITSITYTDASGADVVLDSAAYTLDADAYPGAWVLPADGYEWPDTDDVTNAVRVRFVCGHGSAAEVPELIKLWILATVGTFYANREVVDLSGDADRLLDDFVVY